MNNSLHITIAILLLSCFTKCQMGYAEPNAKMNNQQSTEESLSGPAEAIKKTEVSDKDFTHSKQIASSQSSDEIRLAKAELEAEFYKEHVSSLRWALGIIVAGVLALIFYTIFKDRKEYEKAVSDAKQAAKEARDYEEKAQHRLASINKEVEAKLKEIERKGKEQVKKLLESAKNLQEISFLWNKAAEAYAVQDYETATEIWRKIYDEYKLDNRPFCNNWGSSLLNLARQMKESDPNRKKLLIEAAEKYKKAEKFTKGIAAFNLGCIYALLDDKNECRKWLELGSEQGVLPTRERAEKDPDLSSVRDENWFQELKFRGE